VNEECLFHMTGQNGSFSAIIVEDSRDHARCVVRIDGSIEGASDASRSIIHDLSETGLRLEIPRSGYLGEALIVDLPEIGQIEARIIWRDANFYGVEFLQPLSGTAISACKSISRSSPAVVSGTAPIEEVPVGDDPSIEDISALAAGIDANKGATGRRLLGFRRSEDGGILALVLKGD